MCESNKFLSPSSYPRLHLCYIYLLLVVEGDTRACKSSVVSYSYTIHDVTFVEFGFSPVQDAQFSFLKIDHEARVTRQGRGVLGMRPAAENTLSQSFSDRTRNGINPVVNSNLNNTLS